MLSMLLFGAESQDRQSMIVVVGAVGAPEYGNSFNTWSQRWKAAAERGGAELLLIGQDNSSEDTDRARLHQAIADRIGWSREPLWLILIGHGTFDGRRAKFNLRGPDVTAEELAEWLKPVDRPLAIVNCASASAPFINRLSAPNRVVITSTKSGYEQNYARFGDHLSAAIADPRSDLDKDDQTSLLEAYLSASKKVAEFYAEEGRLATEHALLDDNGDARGTPANWFRGVRATQKASDGATIDGLLAARFVLVRSPHEAAIPSQQREQLDRLEVQIAELRERKQRMDEEAYYGELEALLIQIAEIYRRFGE